MIEVASVIALTLLATAAVIFLVRMLITRSLPDRMVALDALLLSVVSGVAVQAARTGDETYLTVMVVTGLLAFVGTALVARFITRKGL
jgi:multicomponent Na+:H+ antiporter subunit F